MRSVRRSARLRSIGVNTRARKRSPYRAMTASMRRISQISEPIPRIIERLTAHALNLLDIRSAAQPCNNGGKMPEIAHLHIHQNFAEILLAMGYLELRNGAFVLGDRIGEICDCLRFVRSNHAKPCGVRGMITRQGFRIPIDIDKTLGCCREAFQSRAIEI